MKRVKIASKTPEAKVYFKMPNAKPNTKYQLTVEKLVTPVPNSVTLEGALFSLERRLQTPGLAENGLGHFPMDRLHWDFGREGQDPPCSRTFIAKHVKTPAHLVWQINSFLDETTRRLAAWKVHPVMDDDEENGEAAPYPEVQAAEFEVNDIGNRRPYWNEAEVAESASTIQCVLRDGQLGFLFTKAGAHFFAIHFTEKGRQALGFSEWLHSGTTVEENHTYKLNMNTPVAGRYTVSGNAEYQDYTDVEDTQIIFPSNGFSIYSNFRNRMEVVLDTDLPLRNKVVCEDKRSFYRHELAAYQLASAKTHTTYKPREVDPVEFDENGDPLEMGTLLHTYEQVDESNTSIMVFEDSMHTHNKFFLSSTDLQTFTIYLRLRHKTRQGEEWKEVVEDFPFDEGHYYYVQFCVQQM